MKDDHGGPVVGAEAERQRPLPPVAVFRDLQPAEGAHGGEGAGADGQVPGSRKALLFYVFLHSIGKDALIRFEPGKPVRIGAGDPHVAADDVDVGPVAEAALDLGQPARIGQAVGIYEGQDVAAGPGHAEIAGAAGAGQGLEQQRGPELLAEIDLHPRSVVDHDDFRRLAQAALAAQRFQTTAKGRRLIEVGNDHTDHEKLFARDGLSLPPPLSGPPVGYRG